MRASQPFELWLYKVSLMNILRAFKFRIFPSRSQRHKLQDVLDACRWVYNQSLEVRKTEWEANQHSVSQFDTHNLLTTWFVTEPWLRNAHSQVLQDAQARLQRAFENFWHRCKAGEKPGYPRFRSEDRYDSFTFPQSGYKLIGSDRLRISKIGDIRIKRHREISGQIKRVTISRNACGEWFACFQVAVSYENVSASDLAVGIDVGLKTFAVMSDGSVIENPRFFKRDQKRLAKLSRQHQASAVGSERRIKKLRAKNKVWKRVVNRREDFAHQTSRQIANAYGTICVEKLNIIGMMNGNYRSANRSISDVAWARFRQLLAYKAVDAGCQYMEVNPRNTTQMCSGCFEIVPKELEDRVHVCPHCGLVMDRDLNASLNILRLGLESLAKAEQAA